MNKGLKIAGVTVLSALALAAVAVPIALGYRAVRQHGIANSLVIHSTDGIDTAMFVRLGGIDQWVQIRGEHRSNPVLLMLHGGPGFSYMGVTPLLRDWEHDFTIVQWDRRGVGRTFGHNGPAANAPVTFDQMTRDGVELLERLRRDLHTDRVLLLGHSVGSILGVAMAKSRPDLLCAYVGTDQIVDSKANEAESYRLVLEHARAAHNASALADLEKIGPPPYRSERDWFTKQQAIMNTDPAAAATEKRLFLLSIVAPNYSLGDLRNMGTGLIFSAAKLLPELMTRDVRDAGLTFDVPVFLFEGESDHLDLTTLAVQYFAKISAPKKELVVFPGTSHLAMFTKHTEFRRELVARVRPSCI